MASYVVLGEEEKVIQIELTLEEADRLKHAVNLGILSMNLKSREVRKVIALRDVIKQSIERINGK